MDKVTVITVCVNYADYLKQTIARTLDIFNHCLIVTDKADDETARLADQYSVGLLRTDAFYDNGADFNKGLAIEMALSSTGYSGWYLILDADILLPETFVLNPGINEVSLKFLYRFEFLSSRSSWNLDKTDDLYGMKRAGINDKEFAGYFQLFHSSSRFLTTKPWYGIRWRHAGGCDSEFQAKFPPANKHWLPGHVKHLGPAGTNWCGRTPEAQAKLKDYRRLRKENQSYKAEWL